ncbi:hypothetical protein [Streptomyces sp. NPDC015350]|uniref:hypothetical protein n=1 Tax=Streptomyces sp. NPDC015350 TaxID=3364955 RepID=UPI0037035616
MLLSTTAEAPVRGIEDLGQLPAGVGSSRAEFGEQFVDLGFVDLDMDTALAGAIAAVHAFHQASPPQSRWLSTSTLQVMWTGG